jgi:hypothetical protein
MTLMVGAPAAGWGVAAARGGRAVSTGRLPSDYPCQGKALAVDWNLTRRHLRVALGAWIFHLL